MKRFRFLAGVILSFFLMSGCSLQELGAMQNQPDAPNTPLSQQIELAMQAGSIKYDTIDHLEIIDEGVLAFYEYQMDLYACYLTQTPTGWTLLGSVGSVSLKSQNGLTTVGSVTPHKVYYRYGVITDKRIEQILIDNEPAKIVQASNGTKIWFLVNTKDLSSNVTLQCLSNDGKVLYQDKR